MSSHNQINDEYLHLLERIWNSGTVETNARTGVKIKALPGAQTIQIDLRSGLPVPTNRRYSPRVAAAELAWQLLGTQNPRFIMQYAPKMWEKFIEEGKVKAAYGYRWMAHFGRDQIANAVKTLAEDPTNRQVFVSAWDPGQDGLGKPGPKNIPCPVGFTLNVIDERVHCAVHVRSSDVFVGLPYDIMCYALLTDAVASSLGKNVGFLTMTLAHAHIYEPHWKATKDCLRKPWPVIPQPVFPLFSVERIQSEPERFVEVVTNLSSAYKAVENDPKPEVVE